jgi:steroid delta-isomerase-like uncharacterized protein
MMTTDNKELIRRWFDEVWNKGRAEAIQELFAPDGVAHGLTGAGGEPLRGPENFKPFFRTFKDAFPDIEVVVEDTIAEGDLVAARCTVRGRHHGDTLGFAATKRPVEFTGICITRWRDGQIVEAWNNFDFMAMFQQLGVVPPQPGAAST